MSSSSRLPQLPPSQSWVYVAAPFAALTREIGVHHMVGQLSESNEKLSERLHGIIPLGRYRTTLERIAEALESSGYRAILPHRDVNDWGNREMDPATVGEECLRLVEQADLFIGMLGQSFGAHVEAGYALALRKPMILFTVTTDVDALEETFIGRALRESPSAMSIEVNRLEEVVETILGDEFMDLVNDAKLLVYGTANEVAASA